MSTIARKALGMANAVRAAFGASIVMRASDHDPIILAARRMELPFVPVNGNGLAQALLFENVVAELEAGTLLHDGASLKRMAFSAERWRVVRDLGRLRSTPVEAIDGLCAAVWTGRRWSNYHHLMIEACMRCYSLWLPAVRELGPVTVVLPSAVPPVWTEALQQWTPPGTEIRILNAAAVRASRLLYLPYLNAPLDMSFHPSVIQFAHEHGAVPDASGPRRIYISRSTATIRRVANERDLEPLISSLGFSIVRPEELTLREQQSLFAGATHVAGVHGAALTNLLFSRRCSVLEIEGGDPHPHYRRHCESRGLPYRSLHVRSGGKDADMIVDPQELRVALKGLITL